MNLRRTVVSLAALLCMGLAASTARAQSAVRVAVANPARIFGEMQETKDLKQKLEQERQGLEQEVKNRQQKVKDLQAARELLKQDSPQFAQADQAFMTAAIEFDTWSKITQAQLQGHQKQQMKTLFDKIVAATNAVAQQQGIDLVLADQRPELPENLAAINVEQLRAILNGRNVMSVSANVDISPAVIAHLDAQYKASGGAGAAAPPAPAAGGTAPAPAPAPAPAAPKK